MEQLALTSSARRSMQSSDYCPVRDHLFQIEFERQVEKEVRISDIESGD